MSIYKSLGYNPNKKKQVFDKKFEIDPFQNSGQIQKFQHLKQTDISKNQILVQWQTDFKNRILNQQDTFVNVPPAAGKTRPILEAWFDIFSKSLVSYKNYKDTNFPRLLFVVPTRQLSIQIAHTDMLKNFRTGLLRIYINLLIGTNIQNTELTREHRRQAYVWSNEIMAFVTGNIPISIINSKTYGLKPIIIATYEKAQQIILKNSKLFHTVIIDELQEFITKPGRTITDSDTFKRGESFHAIVKNVNRATGLHLLTGSINLKTSINIFKFLNFEYSRNFKLISLGAKDSGNRSRLFLHPVEKLTDISYQRKLIIDLVKQKKQNNVLILFSIRRSAMTGIFRILEDIIKDLPKRNPESLYDIYPTAIRDIKTNKNRTLKIKDLPDIEEKDYIEKGINKRHPLPESLPINTEQKKINKDDIEYLKYFDIDAVETKTNNILKKPDPNNILYQGALGGVGVMVGQMPENFKIIIQKLFMTGKIYVLLATNSLGVGANIKAKNLYIPSLEKFEGTGFMDLDSSTIIQLINRAGRGAFKTANIYTSLKDYNTVRNILKEAPSISISEIEDAPFDEFKKLAKSSTITKIKHIFYNFLTS